MVQAIFEAKDLGYPRHDLSNFASQRSMRRWDCKTLESDLQLAHAQGVAEWRMADTIGR